MSAAPDILALQERVARLERIVAGEPERVRQVPYWVSRLAEAVAEEFGVPAATLSGQSVEAPYVRARFTLVWLLVRSGASYSQIGRWLSRDHSTARHGYHRVEDWRLGDRGFVETGDRLLATATAIRAEEFELAKMLARSGRADTPAALSSAALHERVAP